MNSSGSGFYPRLMVAEERCCSLPGTSLIQEQPFLSTNTMRPFDRFTVNLTREIGTWTDAYSSEQTAYALAQVSAARVLPSLVGLDNGCELLQYRVNLRDSLDPLLLAELAQVLNADGETLHWQQVDESVYAAVIGAGVAACIDMTFGCEKLYFRYTSALVSQLHNARRAGELPRSALFLETALYERFDALLDYVRPRIWHWLIG